MPSTSIDLGTRNQKKKNKIKRRPQASAAVRNNSPLFIARVLHTPACAEFEGKKNAKTIKIATKKARRVEREEVGKGKRCQHAHGQFSSRDIFYYGAIVKQTSTITEVAEFIAARPRSIFQIINFFLTFQLHITRSLFCNSIRRSANYEERP